MALLYKIITYVQQKNAIPSVRKISRKFWNKNFQHKWLFNPDLSRCPHTDILSLCYVDNEGIFCALSQWNNGMHPQSKLTVWNKEPNVRFRPETICGHFIKAEMRKTQCTKRTFKIFIILCQRTSGKREDVKCVLWESFRVFVLVLQRGNCGIKSSFTFWFAWNVRSVWHCIVYNWITCYYQGHDNCSVRHY